MTEWQTDDGEEPSGNTRALPKPPVPPQGCSWWTHRPGRRRDLLSISSSTTKFVFFHKTA